MRQHWSRCLEKVTVFCCMREVYTHVNCASTRVSVSTHVYKEGFPLRVVCFPSFPSHATTCIIIISISLFPFLPFLACPASLVPIWHSSVDICSSLTPWHSASQCLAAPVRCSPRRRLLIPVRHSSRRQCSTLSGV